MSKIKVKDLMIQAKGGRVVLKYSCICGDKVMICKCGAKTYNNALDQSNSIELEEVSEGDVEQLAYDVMGIKYLELSEDKIDHVQADVLKNNLQALSNVLTSKYILIERKEKDEYKTS